jgi:hypothetical protein
MGSPKKTGVRQRRERESVVASDSLNPASLPTEQVRTETPQAYRAMLTIQSGAPAMWSDREEIQSPFSNEEREII